ncbi:MAG: DctP family TRAP transporter solute-binding subunit [Spirochaetaceae bacterium]|jgi:tripartite ATP-independent transporter DctP family solute receptor|nr:DctP family TRAP transporter solute-binding subunit [Spirochaetaceae bacterium]
MKPFKSVFFITILGAAAFMLCVNSCSRKGESKRVDGGENSAVVRLKFADLAADSATIGGQRFKEVAEAESDGTLVIDLFLNNQLGDDRVVVETTAFGDIDIAASSTSPLATLYSDFYLFDVPYLFLSTEEAYADLDGPIGQRVLQDMESVGLKGLCFWENGFRNFTNNRIPVSKPEDMRGMKVRTMENDVHLAAWRAFGANPTPMAFAELFTALQQGTVDAEENSLGIIGANKFYEVQKYISLTQHVYTPYVIVMNLDKYNSLTAVQRAAIDKAAVESTKTQREASQQLEKEILDIIAAYGGTVVELTGEEKAVFQKLVVDNKILELVKSKMAHPEYLDDLLAGK